jgi:hypothetical protein
MKFCSPDISKCCPICDFCKHYHYNGDDKGVYTGDGFCSILNEPKDPEDSCDDFYCHLIDILDENVSNPITKDENSLAT